MNSKIPIFNHEKDIAHLIRNSNTICYAAKIEYNKNFGEKEVQKIVSGLSANFLKTHADIKDVDLYPTRSILVSSNCNLNDDVFDRLEVFAARHTPSHKPTNINHDEHQIVGHMTDNWLVDNDGNIIPDDATVEDLPDLFHIVNNAVIYTCWEDKELVDRTEKLIAEIESGTKYVSVECIFNDFSYAIIDKDDKYNLVARNSQNSFLTKHLRAYGGTGKWNGYKIGRVPQNIIFTAKGYVDNPANPKSVILSYGSTNNYDLFAKAGVSINKEDNITSINTEKDNMSEEYKVKCEELQSKIDEVSAQLAAEVKKVDELNKTVANLTSISEESKKVLNDVVKNRDELKASLDEANNKIKTGSRVTQLVEAGYSKEDASSKVEKFIGLNDEQWTVIAETLAASLSAKPKKEEVIVPVEETEEEAEDKNAKASLENAKPNEQANLAATPEDNSEDVDAMRKELAKMIASKLKFGKEDK